MNSKLTNLNWCGILFDVLLVIVTLGGIWLLPFEQLNRVNLEIVTVVLNGITIIFFHKKEFRSIDYSGYFVILIIGSVVSVLSIISSPALLNVGISLVRGRFEESVGEINSLPTDPRNFILFVGFWAVYASVVGMIRKLFIGDKGMSTVSPS